VLPKPFQYKITRERKTERGRRVQREVEDENLSGFVNGEPASKIEERFAIALRKRRLDFDFQYNVWTAYSLPTQDRVVDFVVYLPPPQPIEVDGEIAHKTVADKEADRVRDGVIDEEMARYNWPPIKRVRGDDLQKQDAADLIIREMFV
jgi:hypothetical protein